MYIIADLKVIDLYLRKGHPFLRFLKYRRIQRKRTNR